MPQSKRYTTRESTELGQSPHGLSTALQGLRYRLHYWASSVETTGRACDSERAEAECKRLAATVEALVRGAEQRSLASEEASRLASDPRVSDGARARVERDRQAAQRAMYPLLRIVMREGLEARLGLFLRDNGSLLENDYDIYHDLLANGAPLPEGLRVCESCALVFATRRKRGAKRCAHCHHRPRSRPPLTMVERPDDGYISRGLPGFNPGTRVVGSCKACGATFYAELANRDYCSSACRKGQTPPAKPPELTNDEREACRAIAEATGERVLRLAEQRRANGEARRVAACDRCFSYYPTKNPAAGRCPECSG